MNRVTEQQASANSLLSIPHEFPSVSVRILNQDSVKTHHKTLPHSLARYFRFSLYNFSIMNILKIIYIRICMIKEMTRPGVQQCQAQGLVFCP